jgi:hypothetical protein
MTKSTLPPHLVDRKGIKHCSACGKSFPEDIQPSLSKAFRLHVQAEHKTKEPVIPPTRVKLQADRIDLL